MLDKSSAVLATKRHSEHGSYVDSDAFAGLRTLVLSFIAMAYGNEHSHYREFNESAKFAEESDAKKGHAILQAIQDEIEGGWIFSEKQLIRAEIFSDFLEMGEHLLNQGYKDPAAVMIGGVLEENLRQLCSENDIETELEKDGDIIPKKADRLNSDLVKKEVYNKLDQKAVTMCLDLRNKAAHGKYEDYTEDQVKLMLQSVIGFLAKVSS